MRRVLGPKGLEFTEDAIGDALATRALLEMLRQSGAFGGGPAPFAKASIASSVNSRPLGPGARAPARMQRSASGMSEVITMSPADDRIVESVAAGDIVITSDVRWPIAAPGGARVLAPRPGTEDAIGDALATRALLDARHRRIGGGPHRSPSRPFAVLAS